MSARNEQPADARHDAPAGSTRRNKRSNVPALATLEDRKLMTGGVSPMMAAVPPVQPPVQVFQANADRLAAPTATLAIAPGDPGVATTASGDVAATTLIAPADAPGDAWIYMGSDAQFGPTAQIVLYGGSSAWPAPQAVSSSDGAATADPAATDSQKALDAAFAKQASDTQAIQDKSEVTPKLIAALRNARSQVASEAGEPDATLLKNFQDDAQAIQQSGTFTDAQRQQLKDEYTLVLKSAGVSDGAIAALFAAQDAVTAAGHVTSDDVQLLAADQKAVQDLLDAMPKPDWSLAASSGVADATILPAFGSAPISARGGLGGVYMNQGSSTGGAAVSASQGGATTYPLTIDPAASQGVVTATTHPLTIDPAAPQGVVTTTSEPVTIDPASQGVVTTTALPVSTSVQPVSAGSWNPRVAALGTMPAGASINGGGKGWSSVPTTYALPNKTVAAEGAQSGVLRRLTARAGGRAGGFLVGNRVPNVQRVGGVGLRVNNLGGRIAQPAGLQAIGAPLQRVAINKMVANDA